MSRQHVTPMLIAADGGSAVPLTSLAGEAHGYDEGVIQALVHAHPAVLPVAEIDPIFVDPVPICRELNTPAGPIDNLLVTPAGLPVLVECKLWRNPQARREVVGQILDYAKELGRWTAADLQREVSRRVPGRANPVLELVREAGHAVDEADFTDALTHNLRRGRFLLLIVGDGIREGVEAIAEYLSGQAGLHFTLGLVELPIFATPDGGRLVVPRVLARTTLITREVVAVPDGYVLADGPEQQQEESELDPDREVRRAFLRELLSEPLPLDPEQPSPTPTPAGAMYLYMPTPAHSCWITVNLKKDCVGLRLTANINSPGEAALQIVLDDWLTIAPMLSRTAKLIEFKPARFRVQDEFAAKWRTNLKQRRAALAWLREELPNFVNTFRPRVREAAERLDG